MYLFDLFRRKQFEVLHILRNIPDCDKEALKAKYPEVDVERYIRRLGERNYENLIGMKIKDLRLLAWKM